MNEQFQFHKGTIRTNMLGSHAENSSEFQFHKGTIRTKLLRLLMEHFLLFQFHKGTIRTWQEQKDYDYTKISIP